MSQLTQSDQTRGLSDKAKEALYATGYSLLQSSRFAEAATVFRIMMRLAPTDERGWLALGECHERIGQNRIALELYSAGARAAFPAARCLVAEFRLLHDDGNFAVADAIFEDAERIAEELEDEALGRLLRAERKVRP